MYSVIFIFLCISSILSWIAQGKTIYPLIGIFIIIVLASYQGFISSIGIGIIFSFFILCYCFYKLKNKFVNIIAGIILSVVIFIVTAQYLPWFKNIVLLDNIKLSELSKPFTIQVNLAKDICGLIMASFFLSWNKRLHDWKETFRPIFTPLLCLIVIIMVPALAVHFIKFDFKIPSSTLLFILNNLLLVSLVEEVFFRGFIQAQLKKIFLSTRLNAKLGPYLAILISSAYFGFAHFHSGLIMIVLAAVAGIGYGYVYNRSGKLESAILTHFGINIIHFIFFTYPSLVK